MKDPTAASLHELGNSISKALADIRGVQVEVSTRCSEDGVAQPDLKPGHFGIVLDKFIAALDAQNKPRDAEALRRAKDQVLLPKDQGGLALELWKPLTTVARDSIMFWVEAWLRSLSSAEHAQQLRAPLLAKPSNTTRRCMTLTEKILAHHVIDPVPVDGLRTGDVVRVVVDWVIASESSYFTMAKTLNQLPEYDVWRNDRFWLVGDHVVDPRTYHTPLNRELLDAANKMATDHKLTDWKGPNYTIIHTEFTRERAEPGQLILGSDSHTCSAGAVSSLAIGLGAGDVAMGLVTGETWFSVPECINIRFVNRPQLGIGGKDIILHILGELKRNTVATDRVVEFSGSGCQYLSVDARFAICNMCTEFGAITGIFVPDDITKTYVAGRRQKHRRLSTLYFQPDEGAQYAGVYRIDLSQVKSLFAIYPSPDHVVPVTEKVGMKLDGCFIGACTTTEEDLIIGALVLQVGLQRQLPLAPGKRKVNPGSIPIQARLEALGLLDVYRQAGFEVGAPGCSYCVGMGVDQAGEGEVWISSQNRNFKNRMGKGSIGNLSSAATVAASAFSMTVTDPSSFTKEVEPNYLEALKNRPGRSKATLLKATPAAGKLFQYVEPNYLPLSKTEKEETVDSTSHIDQKQTIDNTEQPTPAQTGSLSLTIKSKVLRLGDFVDTDQIAPAQSLVTCTTDEELAEHCMKHVMPDFRDKVRAGQKVLVAGKALGCGSSREAAVRALRGLGVQCVIARSFAFIFGRNLPNVGLLGFIIDDATFYEVSTDGADIEVLLDEKVVRIGGSNGPGTFSFPFKLSTMELSLIRNGGLTHSYQQLGKEIFKKLATSEAPDSSSISVAETLQLVDSTPESQELQW